MKRQPLDAFGMAYPKEMLAYLQNYGRHFNKKLYEHAVMHMSKSDEDDENHSQKKKPMTRDEFDAMMSLHGVKLKNDVLYDGMYVMEMAKSDFLGRSIPDDKHLALFVKDYIDDYDAVDGIVFNRYFSDTVLKGDPIPWEDVL